MAGAIVVSPRHQIVDPKTGMATAEELRWRAQMLNRVGGGVAPTINELTFSDDEDSGLEEIRHELTKAIEGLQSAPPLVEQTQVDALQTEVCELREVVAELRKELDDLRQGVML